MDQQLECLADTIERIKAITNIYSGNFPDQTERIFPSRRRASFSVAKLLSRWTTKPRVMVQEK